MPRQVPMIALVNDTIDAALDDGVTDPAAFAGRVAMVLYGSIMSFGYPAIRAAAQAYHYGNPMDYYSVPST